MHTSSRSIPIHVKQEAKPLANTRAYVRLFTGALFSKQEVRGSPDTSHCENSLRACEGGLQQAELSVREDT